jgi:cytoskeletal protein CcmA (bactofilin family)
MEPHWSVMTIREMTTKMFGIIHHKSTIIHRDKGVALLMVLLVIMAIAVISLGFISRCDTELACGRNMLLRTQMDQLADSALEHARGLILQPHDIHAEYWTGATGQQITAESSDFYDVNVARDDSSPDEHRNYSITCEAYRLKNAQKVGSSRLAAQLRLDPCIALWTGTDSIVRPRHVLHGDLYCAGAVLNLGTKNIDGDVFSSALTGTVVGQHKAVTDPLPAWPPVTTTYTNPDPNYSSGLINSGTLSGTGYQPPRIWRYTGNLIIDSAVMIQGMLLVDGNLTIRGNTNSIIASKNLPALYVSGDMVIEDVNNLSIEGLAVVDGRVRISAGASNIHILGGLFVKGTIIETAPDSAAGNCDCIVHDAPTWHPTTGGKYGGALEFDGVNDYLQTLDSLSLQLAADYTISVWLKPAASQKAGAGILAKTNPGGTTNHWALQFDGGNPMELRMFHGSASWATGISLADMAQDRWYNVAVVRQGNKMSSYLDGTLHKPQETWDVGPISGSGHLNIAADRTADSAYLYAGLIDDVRIYNQAVAVPPVDGLPGLIGHWTFDESGSDVTIIAEPARSAIVAWVQNPSGGHEEHWSQAAGAFYRSIRRD